MNLIDVTNTHHHYHSNNKVVVVTKRDGIQGPEGKNGISPHIDPNTLHWFVGDVDTGVFAGMSNTDDVTLIHLFDTKNDFPSAGTTKDLYLDKETSTIYCWDAFLSNYRIFKADYITNLEEIVMNLQSSISKIDNNTLKKPQKIVQGSLILADGDGNTSCTDITYQELLEKIEAKDDVELPTNLTPGALLVGSSTGSIDSSEVQYSELISVIEASKNALKFVGEKTTDNLVLVDESGGIKSSSVSNEELISAVENSKKAVKYKGNVVPGALVLSTEDGIESSNVTHEELIAAIQSSKNAVKFVGDVKHRSLVLADESGGIDSSDIQYSELLDSIEKSKTAVQFEADTVPGFVVVSGDEGGIKNSLVTHSELIAAVRNSQNSVKYEGEVVPDSIVLSNTSGSIKSSELGYSELLSAVKKANTAVQYKGKVVSGSLVLSTEDGIESSNISHAEILETIEKSKKSVSYDGEIVQDNFVVSYGSGIKSSDIKYSDVATAITKANEAVKSKGTIVSGSLMIGSADGVIESSNVTHNELIAAIQSAKTAVQVKGEIIDNSLVLLDKSGNIKSSGKTFDKLIEEIQNSGIQADWNELNNNSPAFIKNKPDVATKTEYDALVTAVQKKSGFASKPTAGNLVMSDGSGNLYSTTLNLDNVVTADTIVAGSFMDYVIIEEDVASTVTIPESVMQYISIDVYHNGKLIVPEVHYLWEAEDYIDLIGFTALKDDIFSFIGHGVTTTMSPFAVGSGTDHTHLNMDVLENITQDRVDAWDTITTHNHDDLYIRKDEPIEVKVPVATDGALGGVKSSSKVNGITVAEDGTMSVNAIDVSLLTSINDKPEGGEDFDLILSSGSSYSYRK